MGLQTVTVCYGCKSPKDFNLNNRRRSRW